MTDNTNMSFEDVMDFKKEIKSCAEIDKDIVANNERTINLLQKDARRTRTFIASQVKDVPFGKTIEFQGYTLEIPKRVQGKKNVCIVADKKNIVIKNKVITLKKFDVLPYPKQDGWYLPERKYGLPVGKEVKIENPQARHLWRRDNEAYLGFVVRGYDWFVSYGRRVVVCGYVANYRCGVVEKEGKELKHKCKYVKVCITCGARKK
jgi:hypothetical protein